MKLDEATAVLRPRPAWEAIDLGCAMARTHWPSLMKGWLTIALPLWLLTFSLLWNHPGWTALVLWWSKPILTRQPIHFLSRSLFGSTPSLGEFWNDRPRSLWLDLLPSLTWRRLSGARSFRLPVPILEGLSGKLRSDRCHLLSLHDGGSAWALTWVAVKLEMAVSLALFFTAETFLPESPLTTLSDAAEAGAFAFSEIPNFTLQLGNLCYAAAIALVEPFYAAAGFSLYINSRTHLEGWDIEVAFRRMNDRLRSRSIASLAALAAACLAMACPSPSLAASNPNPPAASSPAVPETTTGTDDDSPSSRINAILESPDFARDIRRRRIPPPDENESLRLSLNPDAFRWIGYLFIAAAILAVLLIILRGRLQPPRRLPLPPSAQPTPRVVMGMDLSSDSLPANIPEAARQLWTNGQPLESIRLLYRGSLAWMVSSARLPIAESDTETDCLAHATPLHSTREGQYFSALTGIWTAAAYAGQLPPHNTADSLFSSWPFPPPTSPHPKASTINSRTAALTSMALLACCFPSCQPGKAEYEEITVGYRGAARLQPWLAASRLLESSHTVEFRSNPAGLPESETLLFLPISAIRSTGEARSLLDWTGNGNHLVILAAATDRFRNDWITDAASAPGQGEPLLRELKITIEENSGLPNPVTAEIDGQTLSFTTDDGMATDASLLPADVIAGPENKAALVSFPRGAGRITIVPSARPWRNRWIGELDHAALLEGVAALTPTTHAIFLNSSRLSFWQMLITYAHLPLACLAALTAAWLWKNLPRFGRAQTPDTSASRHTASQLADEAAFLWRRLPDPTVLTDPLRRAVSMAAARHGIPTDAPDATSLLATLSGIPEARVAHALHASNLSNPRQFTAAVSDLQLILQSCSQSSASPRHE